MAKIDFKAIKRGLADIETDLEKLRIKGYYNMLEDPKYYKKKVKTKQIPPLPNRE